MKELSIEKKAKRYDKALDRAKKVHKYSSDLAEIKRMEHIFPELRESEDEKIKKDIVAAVETYGDFTQGRKEEIYDWLKRQGENKSIIEMKSPEESLGISSKKYNEIINDCLYSESNPTDNIKTKFNIGDWVIWDNKISCYIDNIYQGKEFLMYTITDTNNMNRSYSVKSFENNARLWTLTDAKPGDILAFDDDTIVIFKDLYNSSTFHSYCHIEDGLFNISKDEMPDWWEGKEFHPATKEQRDIFLQKMKESGYTWDDKNKELKKYEQNHTWSHEDDVMVHDILGLLPTKTRPEYNQRREDWLKSLKGRVQPTSAEWNEEDEKFFNDTIAFFEDVKNAFDHADWIKSLKDRVRPKQELSEEDEDMIRYIGNAITCKESAKYLEEKGIDMIKAHRWLESFKPQLKQEWSEEDEKRVNRISDFIWKNRKGDTDEIYQQEQDANWLKSLSSKVQSKPAKWSEEDERIYQSIIDDTVQENQLDDKQINWLKSLRDIVQSKQWSEDDEKIIRMIDTALFRASMSAGLGTIRCPYDDARDWLESIKQRYAWKPSNEQIIALRWVLNNIPYNRHKEEISGLLEQIKRLDYKLCKNI